MKPSTLKTYKKYENIAKKKLWTEREIISFRKFINGCGPLTENEAHGLMNIIFRNGEMRITQQQSVKGFLWLRNQTFNSRGELRNNQFVRDLSSFEINVIRNFKKFTFVDVSQPSYNTVNPLTNSAYRDYKPVYRVYAKNGDWFDYVSGLGYFEVVDRGSK